MIGQKDKTIALEILRQLGGNRFVAMTGAKNFILGQDALRFDLPAGVTKEGINVVVITLTPADEYRVAFFRKHGFSVKLISAANGVYCDNLCDVFTDHTGILTSL